MAPATHIDGRTARAKRTHSAIVGAVVGLLDRGVLQPSIDTIAAEAGVSPRSIFQHFGDREALEAAVADRQVERVRAIMRRLPREGPFAGRLEAFVDQRARLLEFITPVRRSALLNEPFSSAVEERLRVGRALERREAEQVFARELEACPPAERASLRAALGTVTAWTAWESWRAHQGLSVTAATDAMRVAIVRLLRPAGQ